MATADGRTIWRSIREIEADDVEFVEPASAPGPKWAPLFVTSGVVIFCAAFWAGVAYLAAPVFN